MNKIKAVLRRIVFIIGIITSIMIIAFILFFIYKKVINPESTAFSYNDGPYIFYLNDTTIKSLLIKENHKDNFYILEYEFNLKDSVSLIHNTKYLKEGFNPLETFQFSPEIQYKADRIAVVSDIHGAFNHFKALLSSNKIIDDSSNWSWGNGHLVILGDVFDKGPNVTECFWLIKKLEDQANKQDGEVHLLFGNHERLILDGNTSHVDIKYRSICERLLINYDQLYGADTYIGRWLRSKSATIKINNNLFVHGGISEKMIDNHFTLTNINKYFNIWANSEHLIKYDSITRENINLLISYYGPLEYRGYFNKNIFNRGQSSEFSDELINKILNHFSADHIIVGHTPVKEIKGLFDNKVIAINKRFPEDDLLDDNSNCQILIIEDSNYYKAGINGEKYLLFSE
jgi:hypothetical protein